MVTYKDSGVDIDAGDEAVERISHLVRSTYTPQVLTNSHGGFAGMFRLDYPRGILRRDYRDPVLVACTDGVGTKLEIAFLLGVPNTIGIDLVAMCVNDLVVQGAEPLFFLDYIAIGRMDPDVVSRIVEGIAVGCRDAGCAILGGETAEMPGFYAGGKYDLAGFSVGVAEKSRLILGDRVVAGDVIIGLPSTGIHSNGYSLARRILLGPRGGAKALEKKAPGYDGRTLGEVLLEPTRIYVRPVLSILRHYRAKRPVHAIAHITGGGLPGNVPRVLPPKLDAVIEKSTWTVPPIFEHMAKKGKVPEEEMFRVFNMGIGMVMVTSKHYADSIVEQLRTRKVDARIIGKIRRGKGEVRLV